MKEKNKNSKGFCGPKHGCNSPVYGIGLIGAIIFYISHAGSFMDGVVGILKAFVWPAILVYRALEMFI
jgi:hypothetical protein